MSTLTHGMEGTPTYHSWEHMIQRTTNPLNDAWEDYGGRGITVCDAWLTFEGFFADMVERPADTSLGRIYNDGNYEPGNCAWQTRTEQNNNRRPESKPRRPRVCKNCGIEGHDRRVCGV